MIDSDAQRNIYCPQTPMMNTSEVMAILQHDECLGKAGHFLWVYPRDRLPQLTGPIRPLTLIISSEKHDKPRQHWVALYVNANKKITFLDSFRKSALFYGVEIDKIYIWQLYSIPKIHEANHIQAQHTRSNMRGLFCVFFLYYSCCSLSVTKITNKLEFPRNLQVNDDRLQKFSLSQLRICSKPKQCPKNNEGITSNHSSCTRFSIKTVPNQFWLLRVVSKYLPALR